MEDKKELSEILLGNNKRSSNGKKAVFVVIAALAIIAIVAFLMWKFLSSKEEPLAQPSNPVDTEIMKPLDGDSNQFSGFNFSNDATDTGSNTIDAFNSTMPQDFSMGFNQEPMPDDMDQFSGTNKGQSVQDTQASTEIDNVLDNIKESIKPESKEPAKQPAQAAAKIESKKVDSKDTKQSSSQNKEATNNTAKPAQASVQAAKKPEPKPESKKLDSKEPAKQPTQAAAKPASVPQTGTQQPSAPQPSPTAANGSAPTQGFYWQVGAFEKEPNAEFLALIKKYAYRIQHIVLDNKPNTRYLLGPYKSKAQAPNREEIAQIFKENPTPVEIP